MAHVVKPRVARSTFRMTAGVAIATGVACCWFVLGPVSDRTLPQVLLDTSDSHPMDAAEVHADPPRRLTAEITDVTPVAATDSEEDSATVIFADYEQHPDEGPSIEPVSHPRKDTAPNIPPRKTGGVWLTGTIEEEQTAGTK